MLPIGTYYPVNDVTYRLVTMKPHSPSAGTFLGNPAHLPMKTVYRFLAIAALSFIAFAAGRQTAAEYTPSPVTHTEYRTYCPVTGSYWEPPAYLRDKLWNRATAR
jgi:hypothetical protein